MNQKPLLISLVCLGIIAAAIFGIFEFKSEIHRIEMTRELVQGKFPEDGELKLGFYLDSRNPWYRKNRIGISEDARLESEYIHESSTPKDHDAYTRIGLDEIYCYENSSSSGRMEAGESETEAAIRRIEDFCMEDEALSDLYSGMMKEGVTKKSFKLREHLEFLPIKLSTFPNIYDREAYERKLASKEEVIFRESRLEDYFQFPVPEDMELQLSFNASREGEYLRSDMGAELKEPYASDLLKGFAERNLDGEALFLSFSSKPLYQIPKQFEGIYRLPLHRERGEEHDFDDAFYRLHEIEKIYEFAAGESLEEMLLTDNGLLCLLVKAGEHFELRLIDENGSEKSIRTLRNEEQEVKHDATPRMLRGENGILILYASKTFQWIDSSSLQLSLEGRLDLPIFEDLFHPLYVERCKLLFKDGILYLAASRDDRIFLVHLDKTGILGIVNYRFPLGSEQGDKASNFESLNGFSVEGLSFFIE